MWVEKNLIILPTTNKSSIGLNKSTNRLYTAHEAVHHEMHHLYVLSDEEIKEGDYHFKTTNGKIGNYPLNSVNPNKGRYKKIIATTDKYLNYCSSCGDMGCHLCLNKGLPQISNSFIEHFVSEYNKGNVITKIMVEYEDNLFINRNNNIIIKLFKSNETREE